MAVETWQRWLAVLEDMLQETDILRDQKFGIHISAAIFAAHAKLAAERCLPPHDNQAD